LATCCLVFHHHGLLERVAQVLGDQAAQRVGAAAGRIGHDDLDGFLRPIALRVGLRLKRQGAARGEQETGLREAAAGKRANGVGGFRAHGLYCESWVG
jgi:hypothetical protein